MKKSSLFLLLCTLVCTPLTYASPSPAVNAEGAILIEPHTRTVLYKKNINSPFYPASTTKVLTSLLLVEDLKEDGTITKSADSVANVPSDSSHIGLNIGDTYSYVDGIHGIMMGSDNFISYDMAVYDAGSIDAFAAKMNEKAKSLGANNSNFVNPHGYHDPNHYTTPYDLSLITAAAFEDPVLCEIAGTPKYNFNIINSGKTLPLSHTAQFFKEGSPYFNENVLAAKTGYHTPAGRTLVAKAQYGDLELIAVVMKSGYPTYFEDINTLFEYGAENFEFVSDANHNVGVKNVSYSDWSAPYVQHALSNKWIKPSAKSYMDKASANEFLTMIKNMLPYALKSVVTEYMPTNSTGPFKFNQPITRSESIRLFKQIAGSLDLEWPHIEQGVKFIQKDQSQTPLTIEECIYLTQLIGDSILTDTLITN